MSNQKAVAILGSTGAVGQQALEVIRSFPNRLKVVGIGSGSNYELLSQQVEELSPPLVSFPYEVLGQRFLTMKELASHPDVEILVVATTGAAGLEPTLAALEAGKTVILSSKEIMVMAGEFIMEKARTHGAQIIPVDGALNVIWQCLKGEEGNISELEIMTTASPLIWRVSAELRSITWSELQDHSKRKAGQKTRIDLATMMHEGMQVIEAHHLFGVPYDKIKVTVHPEEIIAAVVGFTDGSKKSILTSPSIRFFLQYAFSHPDRWSNEHLPRLDLGAIRKLTFKELEDGIFPCFDLALEAAELGDTYPSVLNAANETAALLFMHQQIGFREIPRIIRSALRSHRPIHGPSLEDIITADEWGREFAAQQVPV